MSKAVYRAAVARWPAARITLRQGARVVHENQSRTPPSLRPGSAGVLMLGRGGRQQLTFPAASRRLDPRLWNRKSLSRMLAQSQRHRESRAAPVRPPTGPKNGGAGTLNMLGGGPYFDCGEHGRQLS